MQTKKIFLAANWKMHGDSEMVEKWCAELSTLIKNPTAKNNSDAQFVLCPPAVLIPAASAVADTNISIGAQDISDADKGAFTGQISAQMMRNAGCDYAIVGHSERRAMQGESDELIARKTAAALANELTAIVCIGETAAQRENGDAETVIARQLTAVLEKIKLQTAAAKLIIAYEPVWAIGSGESATPEQAQGMHKFIRALLQKNLKSGETCRIIYGGSLSAKNSAELLSQKDIDGGLVGSAGLNAQDFYAILQAANE